ncbi:MarR family winged helix-turn-helix transcriptional regulator [Cellulomonas sp. URHE0023]|uniref:MarR family winged helix-turn-helix transcriptional regulator n=1 Tax=Cellulomonas sp. URHE0023 TaxID=1380354 RepID=UPI000485A59B|nr:MarR family winged helix-turn-helix transcriptional regulator [Cellulomonas sp. URHE0023]
MADDVTRPPARLRALVSWQVSKVNTVGSRLTSARMPLTGRADFAVLAALEEYGTLSQAELGRRLGLDRNDVNGVVNRLQGGGHLTRDVDLADRRRNTLSLTDAGRRYLDDLQTSTDAVQAELVAALTPDEGAQLRALLTKLLESHPVVPS